MLIGTTCTTCRKGIASDELAECEICGQGLHTPCREYETTFECQTCGTKTWIGALEF